MTCGCSKDRIFKCSWQHCCKSFNRKSDFNRHFRIHTGERPYHCAVVGCNKRFIQRSALTVHSRTHTGEKPHICDHVGCQKSFTDSSSLARHRRIHTGKRLFVCQEPTCKRSFCRKTTLTNHQNRSHAAESLARPFSDHLILEQSFQHQPVTISAPSNDQYSFAPQIDHPEFATPSRVTYSPQDSTRGSMTVQGHEVAPQIVAETLPLGTLPLGMAHVEQQRHQQETLRPPAPSEQQQQSQNQAQYLHYIQQLYEWNPHANDLMPGYYHSSIPDSHLTAGRSMAVAHYPHFHLTPITNYYPYQLLPLPTTPLDNSQFRY